MSTEIQYKRLDADNFTLHSLDDFVRHQTVTESWRIINEDWKLVPNVYEEKWTLEQRQKIAEDITQHIKIDQIGFGAFDGERLIGFVTVSRNFFGVSARYAQLVCFQVSEEYRRRGIGKKLFSMICKEALGLGAEKLYISAHSSKESQAAYRALGCTLADEVNEKLAAEEPFDVQMEYRLAGGTTMENKKSLVVIDIQNDITKNYRLIIDKINAAIDWARENGMEIVYIKHNNLFPLIRAFRPNTKGAEFAPDLKVVSDNIFVKTKANALTSDAFFNYIWTNSIDDFYITGADATACVKSTCFNMVKAGHTVHVLSDCVTSYNLKKVPEMLDYYASKGCEVKTLAEYQSQN